MGELMQMAYDTFINCFLAYENNLQLYKSSLSLFNNGAEDVDSNNNGKKHVGGKLEVHCAYT